jgi:hypothetical protein
MTNISGWEAQVEPWGKWQVVARNTQFEAVLEATCKSPGTPLRAPTPKEGLNPICRDSFEGQVCSQTCLWLVFSGCRNCIHQTTLGFLGCPPPDTAANCTWVTSGRAGHLHCLLGVCHEDDHLSKPNLAVRGYSTFVSAWPCAAKPLSSKERDLFSVVHILVIHPMWESTPWEVYLLDGCDILDLDLHAYEQCSVTLGSNVHDVLLGQCRVRLWRLGSDGQRQGDPFLDARSSRAAVETGGGPWWDTWRTKAEMREPLRSLVKAPIDPGYIASWLPSSFRPRGL